jgi:hypothetical protein
MNARRDHPAPHYIDGARAATNQIGLCRVLCRGLNGQCQCYLKVIDVGLGGGGGSQKADIWSNCCCVLR